MSVALTSNALTTLATLKSVLGISGSTEDDNLNRAINVASQRIQNFLNRKLYYQAVTDEPQPGNDATMLYVDVYPIVSLTSITEDDATVAATSYEVSDADHGEIYRSSGLWSWNGRSYNSINRDPAWDDETYNYYKITYTGGYVLPKDAVAASLTSAAETYDFAGGKSLVLVTDETTTSVSFVDGNFSTPAAATAAEVAAVISAALGDDLSVSDGSAGTVVITRTGDYHQNTLQASGMAATALTLSTTEQAGTRTLPYDLEQSAIQLAIYVYRNRKSTGEGIQSEKLLSYSVSYSGPSQSLVQQAAMLGIPAEVALSLGPYRRMR